MAKKKLTVRKNADGTVTVRGDNYIEHFATQGRVPAEMFEIVRWGILTAGFFFSEEIERMVKRELRM